MSHLKEMQKEASDLIKRVSENATMKAKSIVLNPTVERNFNELEIAKWKSDSKFYQNDLRIGKVTCNIFKGIDRDVWTIDQYIDQLIALRLKGHIRVMSEFIAGKNSISSPRLLLRVLFSNTHVALMRFRHNPIISADESKNEANEYLYQCIKQYNLPISFVDRRYFSKTLMTLNASRLK